MIRGTSMYLNRELSWLEFNQRVLNEALDPDVPLLERLNFLSITGSNLDEFFMVRVGGLELLAQRGGRKRDPSGMTPRQQLDAINRRVCTMVADQYRCWQSMLEPQLRAAGIVRLRPDTLNALQAEHLQRFFDDEAFPVMTPMALHPDARPTAAANLRLNLAVRLAPETAGRRSRFAILPLPAYMHRVISVPSDGVHACVLLEDVVRLQVERFFAGETVRECVAFRITRNADLVAGEDFAGDFLREMENVLIQRKESDCVRLEVEAGATRILTRFLESLFNVHPRGVYRIPGPIDLSAFGSLASIEGFEAFKYEPWQPQAHPETPPGTSMFDILSRGDVLLAHPYDAYDPVLRLIEEAADDPDVLAIKQILYRTSADSPVIGALQRAAEAGKHVTVIVELKARFDEARNIAWARELERAGAQVIYGVKGYKTHAKALLVVRREPRGITRYLHFGTGNYNERTARLYSDISLMTRDPDLAADTSAFFNAIAGYSASTHYQKLRAAPTGIKPQLLELIRNEAERKRQGQKALIMAKLNALVDRDIIDALYDASRDGVEIRLNVRGICCLKPGIKGLSKTIEVVSIVDRYLEHSRIFCFHHGGADLTFISSADWMPRNLERRIELMIPVGDPPHRRRLVGMLRTYFRDNVKSSRLLADGTYERKHAARARRVRSQEHLHRQARKAASATQQPGQAVFEPHRPAGTPP